MNKINIKKLSISLCILIILIQLTAMLYICINVDHHCSKSNCSICIKISNAIILFDITFKICFIYNLFFTNILVNEGLNKIHNMFILCIPIRSVKLLC